LDTGDVDRLAHRAARVVDRRRHVGELHEIAEILDGGIAPPLVEIADERRPVNGREHRGIAADAHRALRVAGVLDELGRRRPEQLAHQPLGKPHPLAADVGAGGLPHVERLGVVAELDADLLQHDLGIGLDQGQPLLAVDFIERDVARNRRQLAQGADGPRGPAAFRPSARTAAAASWCVCRLGTAHGSPAANG
jgi:hypothetical protein